MTKEEAIKRLEWIRGSSFCRYSSQSVSDSLDMAISALRYGGPKYVLLSTPPTDAQTIDTGVDALREQISPEKTAKASDEKQATSGWISVEERLPDSVKDVLTCRKNGYVQINYMLMSGKWCYGPVCVNPITHWMPLPEPPKEEE